MVNPASLIPLPPEEFIQAVGGGNFEATGQHFFRIFVNQGGLLPSHRVLDVGSGCGRMAIPLTTYLDDQTEYHGLDIVEPMVAWCVENITARFPNFKFHHVSLKNSLYSSKAELSAATYKFPFPDEYFDFVFLTSVFTHLKPSDTKNYLKEVQRVLKINGRVLMSFYLITADYRTNRRKKNGRALITFDYGFYPYWYNERKVPEAIAGYDEGYVFRQIRTSGLSMEAVYYGGWNGNRGLTWQDIIVASRRT